MEKKIDLYRWGIRLIVVTKPVSMELLFKMLMTDGIFHLQREGPPLGQSGDFSLEPGLSGASIRTPVSFMGLHTQALITSQRPLLQHHHMQGQGFHT